MSHANDEFRFVHRSHRRTISLQLAFCAFSVAGFGCAVAAAQSTTPTSTPPVEIAHNDPKLETALEQIASGSADPKTIGFAFENYRKVNRLGMSGAITPAVYQSYMKLFVTNNANLLQRAAKQHGFTISAGIPNKNPDTLEYEFKKGYEPGTDTDSILGKLANSGEISVDAIKKVLTTYQDLWVAEQTNRGLDPDSLSTDYSALLDTDIMPSHKDTDPEVFRQINEWFTSMGKDVYHNVDSVAVEVSGDKPISAKQLAAYGDDVTRLIKKKQLVELSKLRSPSQSLSDFYLIGKAFPGDLARLRAQASEGHNRRMRKVLEMRKGTAAETQIARAKALENLLIEYDRMQKAYEAPANGGQEIPSQIKRWHEQAVAEIQELKDRNSKGQFKDMDLVLKRVNEIIDLPANKRTRFHDMLRRSPFGTRMEDVLPTFFKKPESRYFDRQSQELGTTTNMVNALLSGPAGGVTTATNVLGYFDIIVQSVRVLDDESLSDLKRRTEWPKLSSTKCRRIHILAASILVSTSWLMERTTRSSKAIRRICLISL